MNDSSTVGLEPAIREIGAALHAEAGRSRPGFFHARGVRGAVLAGALEDEALRRALFQFVDVLPELQDSDSVARHFSAYTAGREPSGGWGRLMRLGRHPLMAWAVRSGVSRTARLFLVEENRSALARVARSLARAGAQMTVDAVGEAVLTEHEAERYAERYARLIDWQSSTARPHVSIKLSGLTPRFDPIDPRGSIERVLARIAPLMQRVLATNAALTVDMEHHELKPLVLDTFKALVERYPERTWHPGIAVQAYLHETHDDLVRLLRWVRAHGRPVSVRLVKGAYWDTEVALAGQREWPVPVFLQKSATDASYERLTRILFENADLVFPAIAGHNLRSLAHAIAAADAAGLPRDRWEVQMLYGMAEPLQAALAQRGVALRIYVPTGELVTGIAYLIRRLLENTASSSVLRQTYAEAQDTSVLLAAPVPQDTTAAAESTSSMRFRSTPLLEFSRSDVRERFAAAVTSVAGKRGARYPLMIAGAAATDLYGARNPAQPDEILGEVELTDAAGATKAVANANRAWPEWRATPVSERVRMIQRAAALMLEKRLELAAWQVFEQAKNWREADADVAEAIDYLHYYAAEMERLQGWRTTIDFPGETNATRFEPRGTAVIVAPWNFPLAILAGMTSAALVTGNCAIMKAAMPAQIVAHLFHRILLEAGIPAAVCQLVPGRGSEVGDVLVDDPRVHVIAFTGSREVGQRILERAARFSPEQEHVKRVVCEMGGKNAIIVDEDADLDEVVRETVHSAFGYQGQKCSACSRLIAVGSIHDRLLTRLVSALDAWPYGPPQDPQFTLGPLITEAAQRKTLEYIEIGQREGRLVYRGRVPETGYYVAPAIFADIRPRHRLAREEIFGPVLSVMHAATLEEALDVALDSRYALTGGVFSRLPEHLEIARERFSVGNVYLNRRITGARVGVQPFGGYRLSGTGIQAGGEEYLKQFMWSRVVTENTVRHGYVPT